MGQACCTDRKETDKALRKASLPPLGVSPLTERIASELREMLLREAPAIVCIAGGTQFHRAGSEDLIRALAPALVSALGARAVFVTTGLPGGQEVFATSCGDASRLWHVCPDGAASGYNAGTDLAVPGGDDEEASEIFAVLGDVYVTVEGGPRVATEAALAHKRGATILPIMRTGGASSGKFEFPPEALEKPPFATEAQWALLSDEEASVQDVVEAVISLGTTLVRQAQERQAAAKTESHPASPRQVKQLQQQRVDTADSEPEFASSPADSANLRVGACVDEAQDLQLGSAQDGTMSTPRTKGTDATASVAEAATPQDSREDAQL